MLVGHGAAALPCPWCGTLLKGGCAQWADQCRADGDCCHATRSSVGVGAEEPWGMWDLALAQKWACVSKSGPLCPWCTCQSPPHLVAVICIHRYCVAKHLHGNSPFRNSAESLLSSVGIPDCQCWIPPAFSPKGPFSALTWSQER